METYTDQDLIAELLEISPRYPPRTGGITAQEWAEAKGVHISNAHAFLRRQVAAGMLRVEDNWSESANRSIKVFYRATDNKE